MTVELRRLPQWILLSLIRAYRFFLSPWVGGACRYWPTCSEYALDAIRQHGALRGGWLMLGRLARCHPYGAGGVDPGEGVELVLGFSGLDPGEKLVGSQVVVGEDDFDGDFAGQEVQEERFRISDCGMRIGGGRS